MSDVRVFAPEEMPGLVAEAIRSIRRERPEFQSHLRKRLAQFNGLSLSWTDKLVNGQFERLDAAHLLNADQFFEGLLIPRIRGGQMSETERQELLTMAREIQRIAGKWTFGNR